MEATGSSTSGLVITDREIGRVMGNERGPTLMVVGGIHGNEPAGVIAARRVFAHIAEGTIKVRGEFVFFAGNLAGLRSGVRYHVKDLNRQWSEHTVEALKINGPTDAEDHEQVALLAAMEVAHARARGPVTVGDLHTSSAQGIPFVLFGDTLAQRAYVRVFPIPVVMGLEEQVDGVLAEYWTRRGCVTFSVEGGQHVDPASVDSLEAVLWLALAASGCIDRELPEVARSEALLDARRAGLPRVLEVVSRRAITAEDAFRMEPGFRNLDHAAAGRLLAHDRRGEIRAPSDGMVILPLYQGLGSDGFFWGRAVSDRRMRAARVLRSLGADRLLGLLPGVDRDPGHPSRFILRTPMARRYPLEIFHTLGYRRVRTCGETMSVERNAG